MIWRRHRSFPVQRSIALPAIPSYTALHAQISSPGATHQRHKISWRGMHAGCLDYTQVTSRIETTRHPLSCLSGRDQHVSPTFAQLARRIPVPRERERKKKMTVRGPGGVGNIILLNGNYAFLTFFCPSPPITTIWGWRLRLLMGRDRIHTRPGQG